MAKPLPASLTQKIAQSQLGSGPSLVPQAPVKEPEEVVPTVEELIGEAEDLQTLKDLVAAISVPKAEVKRLDKIVDSLSGRIKILVSQYGIAKAKCGESLILYYPTTRSTINATKLLAAGVEQETITACTDVSRSFTLKIS